MKTAVVFLFVVFLYSSTVAQNTAGTVTFQVTTVSNGGQYSPKNILAIWVKNSSGTFVRTLKLNAQQRIQYLYKWKNSSSLNTVDALTGATLLSHQTHQVTWNCTTLNGAVAPDGTYDFWVEFADDDFQGPYTHYSFSKGTSPVSTTFPDQTRFKNVSINYVPQTSGVGDNQIENESKVIVNNGSVVFDVPAGVTGKGVLEVFDMQGKMILKTNSLENNSNRWLYNWYPPVGIKIFIYRISTGSNTYSGKVFIQNL